MSFVLAKVCAVWLVVLVWMPFTAPFSTVDLVDLLAGHRHGITRAASPNPPTTAVTRASLPHAVPLPSRVGRLRVDMGRVRLCSLVAASPHLERAPVQTSASPAVGPASRSTVLRI